MQLTLMNLEQAFGGAMQEKAKFLGIAVTVPGATGLEVMINPRENFEAKLNYIKGAYNEDLTHKTGPLQIVGFTYGNTYRDIQRDLLG